MTAKNRAALIGKLHTSLKKHYKPAPPAPGRPLMEHVLYASLLEDSPADLADEGFAKCEQEFFDWNEVRVTTVTELAEVLSRLPSPSAAAIRLKRNLQSMFEAFYNFDIDHLKKENLGKAVAKFEAMPGISPFVLSYLVQHGLGGHAIPIDKSAMKVMWLSGIVTDAESSSGKVPGLERTIPKNKSIEFSSLLHQAGIAFSADANDKVVWDIILSVNKDAKALLNQPAPKPKPKKAVPPPVEEKPPVETTGSKSKFAGTVKAKPTGKSAPAEAAAKSGGDLPAEKGASKTAGKSGKTTKETTNETPKASSPKSATTSAAPAKSAKAAAAKPTSGKSAAKTPVQPEKPVKASVKDSAKAGSSKDAKSKGKKAGDEKTLKPSSSAAQKGKETKPISAKKGSPEPKSTSKSQSVPAKEPSKKSVPSKPLSAKSTSSKPSAKSSDVKPASKKTDQPDLASKKSVTSANKKLTKQKPR